MTDFTKLPYAAVGAAARTARTIGDRIEGVRRDVTTAAESFITQSADEGRAVIARIPGSARLLGAANASTRPVTDIVGVDARSAAKLRRAGVSSVSDMWSRGGDRPGRNELSGTTGIEDDRLADWARKADLMRVKSIGPRYAALLDAAGVTSLKQLRRRSAESLHESLMEANRSAKVVESVPGVDELAQWIEKADLVAG